MFPHVTPKTLVFQILAELAAALAILSALAAKRAREPRSGTVVPAVIAWAGIFLAYSLVSAAVGTDLRRSLWGFIERQDGLVLLVHFFAWLAVLFWYCALPGDGANDPSTASASLRRATSFLFFSFWVSVAVSLTALWQALTAPEAAGSLIDRILRNPTRVSGVFGNPLFVAPYILFHVFWGAYYARSLMSGMQQAPRRPVKTVLLLLVLAGEGLLLLTLLAGQTRAAILGLVGGLAVVAALLLFSPATARRWRVSIAAGLLATTLAGTALWYFRDSGPLQRMPVLSRLGRLAPGESESSFARVLTWRSALEGFWDHPVFGWGHDNVYYALNQYYDPRHVRLSPELFDRTATWADKSHSFLLDLLVERGVFGLALFVWFSVIVTKALIRIPDRFLTYCLLGGLTAYLITNLFAFDTFGSLLGFYLSLACVAAADPGSGYRLGLRSREGSARPGKQPSGRRPAGRRSLGTGAAAVVAAAVTGTYLNVEMAIANHKYYIARGLFEKDASAGIDTYVSAFRHFSPYHAREKLYCASLIVSSAVTRHASSRNLEAGELLLRLAREAVEDHPRDTNSYLMLNDMYNQLALHSDPGLTVQAEAYGRKALELSPNRQEVMINLGRTYLLKNEPSRAIELNSRAVAEYPDFPLAHWFLGLSFLANRQPDAAKPEIRRALELGYRFKNPEEEKLTRDLFGEREFALLKRRT